MLYKEVELLVGESQSQLLIDEDGVYEAKVSNSICATRSDPINVFTLSSHLAQEMNLSLYPNPVRNQLHIDVPEGFS
jgi:hypothetical protein